MFQFTDARVVSLVFASEVAPFRADIAVQSHPLDAEIRCAPATLCSGLTILTPTTPARDIGSLTL